MTMKTMILTIAFALAASTAGAVVTCTTYGNTVRCWDSETGQSQTCTVYGNTMRCY